jgi:hypothetical protein
LRFEVPPAAISITISQPLAALFWEKSLLQCRWHVLGVESSGFQLRRSR